MSNKDTIRAVAIGGNIYRIGDENFFSGVPTFADSKSIGRTPTEIKMTERSGQMASVPWIEIWVGDQIWIEFDASHATGIEYEG